MTMRTRILALAGLAVSAVVMHAAPAPAAPPYLEPGFGDDGVASPPLPTARDVEIAPTGRIVFTISGASVANLADVAALRSDGTLDETFGDGGAVRLDPSSSYLAGDLAIDDYGRILVLARGGLWRLLPDGELDTSFGTGGFVDLAGLRVGDAIGLRADGRILVAGGGDQAIKVAQLEDDGSIDRSFGTDGRGTIQVDHVSDTGDRTKALAVQVAPDGGVVVGGSNHGYLADWSTGLLAKFTENGDPETAFGDPDHPGWTGSSKVFYILDSGDIMVMGGSSPQPTPRPIYWYARRLTPTGQIDPDFAGGSPVAFPVGYTNGTYYYQDVAPPIELVQLPDGRFVALGIWNDRRTIGEESWAAVMFTSDGEPVQGYGEDGVVRDTSGRQLLPSSAALDQDGTIVMAGAFGGEARLGRLLTEPIEPMQPPISPDDPSGAGAVEAAAEAKGTVRIHKMRVPGTTRGLARRGVRALASCPVDCRLVLTALIPQGLASQLGLRSRVVASGSVFGPAGKRRWVTAFLKPSAERALLAYGGGGKLRIVVTARRP